MPRLASPFLVGRELEYGIHLDGHDPTEVGRALLSRARHRFPSAIGSRHGGRTHSGTVFLDGEVLYLDPWNGGLRNWFNLEAALYESDDPWMLHRRRLRAEARLRLVASETERELGVPSGSLRILGLGDDFYLGRTRGYHFNYLSSTPLYQMHVDTLVLWIVAGCALFGAGGLGGARGVLCDARADHLGVVHGGSIHYGSSRRGMLNEGRGELCGGRGTRIHLQHQGNVRLGAILSDGITMLVLRALEHGAICFPDPLLEPVEQMQRLASSPEPLEFPLRLRSGREMLAREVLLAFDRELRAFLRSHRRELPRWAAARLLPAFGRIVSAAWRRDLHELSSRLDSWMRLKFYDETARRRFGVSLGALAPWMPVAAYLGRERIFRAWDGAGRGKRRGREPRCLADLWDDLGAKARSELGIVLEGRDLDRNDPTFPSRMEAIRTLADLEFRLGSVREDNPFPALMRAGVVRPVFREALVAADPFATPPRARNRSRPRSILIRRLSSRARSFSVTWTGVTVDPDKKGGEPLRYDLTDPFRTEVPPAERVPPEGRRRPRRWPRFFLPELQSEG